MLVGICRLQEAANFLAELIAHHSVGTKQVGAAVFAAAGILGVAVGAVGAIARFATRHRGRVGGWPGREAADALSPGGGCQDGDRDDVHYLHNLPFVNKINSPGRGPLLFIRPTMPRRLSHGSPRD